MGEREDILRQLKALVVLEGETPEEAEKENDRIEAAFLAPEKPVLAPPCATAAQLAEAARIVTELNIPAESLSQGEFERVKKAIMRRVFGKAEKQ